MYEVQVGKDRGKYTTKYSFPDERAGQAILYYRSVNVGPRFKKRLMQDGKLIHRVFG